MPSLWRNMVLSSPNLSHSLSDLWVHGKLATPLINESGFVLGSSLKLRIGFRNKRFGRLAERSWRFRAQLRTKHELVRFAKRSESLRYILKQYGVTVEKAEENKTSSRLDDLNFEEKHNAVPSSVKDDSKMVFDRCYGFVFENTIEDLRWQEKYIEAVITSENLSRTNHHNLHHLNAGALFICLLPVLGFCIIGRIISRNLNKSGGRKTSRGHHRWRSALSDLNEPFPCDEHESLEYRVGSENQEAMDEAYNRVELEYQRFLAECGVSES